MEKQRKKMNGGIVVLSVICGCFVFIVIWSMIISSLLEDQGQIEARLEKAIDVIYVEGTIEEGGAMYNHLWTLNQIDYFMEDESNEAIFLYVNSPGGGVYESDELYLKLMDYKEVTGRPVYAYMAQTAASGGLYICMAADKIYANRMTMTGSIGVIMTTTDTTGLQELIGIKEDRIVSGKNKAMGNPLTEEQRGILQTMIDETYDIFVQIVSENRNIDLETTKKLADGRIYSALQAKELNLIDEIGTYEDALEDLKATYGLEDCSVYSNSQPTSIWQDMFGGLLQGKSLLNEFTTIEDYISKSKSSKLMYYYGG